MKKISAGFLVIVLVALFLPSTLFAACGGCTSGALYKGFELREDTGYFAREFDKFAPAPGINWSGQADEWLGGAFQNGWIVKTSPASAKTGAIIVGVNQPNVFWIGIVREVTSTSVIFDAFGSDKKLIQKTVDFEILSPSLIGYIWPERQEDAAQAGISKH
jgi:hypothetical protein